jgi:hypothetical protein
MWTTKATTGHNPEAVKSNSHDPLNYSTIWYYPPITFSISHIAISPTKILNGFLNLYPTGGGYLNFSTWFMKNMSIIWAEKDKIMK